MTADVIADGRAAWSRLQRRERQSWQDWLAVGNALTLGRTEALAQAGTNSPQGSRYNKAMGDWLRDNGLDGISAAERYKLIQIVEHLTEIEAWRAGLAPEAARRLNHPSAVWSHWRATTKPRATPAPPRRVTPTAGKPPHEYGGRVSFDQDTLRRAAIAVREVRSTDCMVIALACLRGAIRGRDDLQAMLDDSAPRRRNQASVQAAAMA